MSTVLIVDDDEDIRDIVGMILEKKGYTVRTACDGAEALALVRGGLRASVILLDLMMPGMNGEDFKAALDRIHHAPVHIVVLSGSGRGRRAAEEIGADGFVQKPVELSELLAVVERFAGQRGGSPDGPP